MSFTHNAESWILFFQQGVVIIIILSIRTLCDVSLLLIHYFQLVRRGIFCVRNDIVGLNADDAVNNIKTKGFKVGSTERDEFRKLIYLIIEYDIELYKFCYIEVNIPNFSNVLKFNSLRINFNMINPKKLIF